MSNLISGKACLNPVSEKEDLQYKLATMQALRYMANQDSQSKLERTTIKLKKTANTETGVTTLRDISPTIPIMEIPQKSVLPVKEMLLEQ